MRLHATVLALLIGFALPTASLAQPASQPDGQPAQPVTLKGSLVCYGACVPKPTPADHHLVLYAIDGPAAIHGEAERIVAKFYPAAGLDADAAVALMDQFSARLTYHLAPDSPALADAKNRGANHYCMPAAASAVTGIVTESAGRRWIRATSIQPAKLAYPERMAQPDRPLTRPDRDPLVLKVADTLTLKCVAIPAGKFLMGTPFYMWPYYVEEYPHVVTITRPFFLGEIPVTQEMWQAVMGDNPSTAKGPQLPVENPRFADIDRFCRILSAKNGRTVRLPTDAEWEYAARVGTSDPPFPARCADQNSTAADGKAMPVKSRKPNGWGLCDMASCWWEITAGRGMYNVRESQTDPAYPPPADGRAQRSGRGFVQDRFSLATHEFITEKGYAGQKFRVAVEVAPASRPGKGP